MEWTLALSLIAGAINISGLVYVVAKTSQDSTNLYDLRAQVHSYEAQKTYEKQSIARLAAMHLEVEKESKARQLAQSKVVADKIQNTSTNNRLDMIELELGKIRDRF